MTTNKIILALVLFLVSVTIILAQNETNTSTAANDTNQTFIDVGNQTLTNETVLNESIEVNETLIVPEPGNISNGSTVNETAVPAETDVFTKIKDLTIDKISAIKGAAIRISATLVDTDDNPLESDIVNLYADENLVDSKETDASGHVVFDWNTSQAIPGDYLINVSYPGKTITSVQETINFMPSYNFTFVTIEPEPEVGASDNSTNTVKTTVKEESNATVAASETQTQEVQEIKQKEGNYHLTTRDTAWTILQKDYITKYIDYDFVYVNDSYYRVDWKWNDEYVKDVLRNCVTKKGRAKQNCLRDASMNSMISTFESKELAKKQETLYYEEPDLDVCFESDDPNERLTCVNEKTESRSVTQKQQLITINKWPKRINYTDVYQRCNISNGNGDLNCKRSYAISAFEQLDYDIDDFSDSFFSGGTASLENDINYLKSHDVPKEIIKGNAEIIGTINPLNQDGGSFYIELKDGFQNSNGLRLKWGLSTTLAEFNNSKSEENLSFTFFGYRNITRYLELPRYAVVSNATFDLTGSRIPLRNFTMVYRVEGENTVFYHLVHELVISDEDALYVIETSGPGPTNITKFLKENMSQIWNFHSDSVSDEVGGIAVDDDSVYLCLGQGSGVGSRSNVTKINKNSGVFDSAIDDACMTNHTGIGGTITINRTEGFLYSTRANGVKKINVSTMTVNASQPLPYSASFHALRPQTICQNTNNVFVIIKNTTFGFSKNPFVQIWNTTNPDPGVRAESLKCIADDKKVFVAGIKGQGANKKILAIFNAPDGGINSTLENNFGTNLVTGCSGFDTKEWQNCGYIWQENNAFSKRDLSVNFSYGLTNVDDIIKDLTMDTFGYFVDEDVGDAYVINASTSSDPVTLSALMKVERSYIKNLSFDVGSSDNFIEYSNISNFNESVNVGLNVSSLNSALNGGECDCIGCELIGDMCSIPIIFSSNSTGMLQYSNINVIYNTNPVFTENATDGSNLTDPVDRNSNVTFTANISDTDNDDVKLLICDTSGRSGTDCLDTEYCSDGFEAPGNKSCQLNTSSLTGVEYNWTSFACDNSSACADGVNGTFYITRPNDPVMYVNGSEVWNYTGLFDGPVTVENFEDEVQSSVDGCDTDDCNVSLTFYSDSKGKLELSLIDIQYEIYDTEAPVIHNITVEPSTALVNSSINVSVNASDNVNLTRVVAAHREDSINLTYNSTTSLWEGSMSTPSTVGLYQINVTAIDSSNLNVTNFTAPSGSANTTESSSCPPEHICTQSGGDESESELMIYSSDITHSPNTLSETDNVTINATVYNFGGADADNFKVELQVDDVHQTYNTVSLGGHKSIVTQFNWNATLGNHTLKIVADYTNVITEDNETNNNGTIDVNVQDITPPSISGIVAERGSLTVKVNITDNQNISSAVAVVNGTEISLTYNHSSGLYEGSDNTIGDGTYSMEIRATDVDGLVTTLQSSIIVYPDPIDLSIYQNGLWLSAPSPADKESVVVYARVHNRGVNSSGNFTVEFLLDDISQANNSVSIEGDGNTTTQFNWAATYGNHTVTVEIDVDGNISELNKSNNEVSRNISVSDTTAPVISQLTLPEIVYEGGDLMVTVNVTDNVNLSYVNASINSSQLMLVYNSGSELYENTSAALSAGTYVFVVNATDSSGLTSALQENLIIYDSGTDLALSAGDIDLIPDNVTEDNQLTINATIYNRGGTDANSVQVELLIDGASIQNNTYSVAKASSNVTEFTWTSVYGSHNLTVKADPDNAIAESNESNNERNRSFFVLDITAPPQVSLTASPSNWTNQTTHNISWSSVSDTNGISRYEYRVDYGNWTSVGLNTSFVTPPQGNGVHVVYVRATDVPGNTADPSNVSVYIDLPLPNAPVIKEWHSGSNWSSHNTPYLSWVDPGDDGSGITNFTISVDGGSEINLGSNLSYHSSNLSTGNHTFRVRAYDALNQASNWSNTVTVYIDTTLPESPQINSSTHPDNSTWYDIDMPFFNLTPPAEDSGIQGYYYVFDKASNTTPDVMSLWTANDTINISHVGGGAQYGLNGTNDSSLGVANGEWYLHVIAQDTVGNLGTEVSHYGVKINNSNASVLAVSGLAEIYSSTSDKVFEFVISNTGANNASANWTIDFGDGNVVSSNVNTSLTPSETLFVIAEHSYSAHGTYTVKATAQADGSPDSANISSEIEYIEVSNTSVINISGTSRTFEFIVTNPITSNLSDIAWSFDTDNSFQFNSTVNTSLIPDEIFFVFIDYDYGSAGNFTVNASVWNNSVSDDKVLNVTIS